MTRREKTKELFIELINEQLKPHGVTYDDVKEDPQWYLKYSTTEEKEKEFIDWVNENDVEIINSYITYHKYDYSHIPRCINYVIKIKQK